MTSTSVNSRRRQNQPLPSSSTSSDLLSPTSHQPQQYSYYFNAPRSNSPSSSDFSDKLLQRYLDSTVNPSVVIDTSNIPISSIDQYMPNSFDFQQNQVGGYPYSFPESEENLPVWSALSGGNMNGVANPTQTLNRGGLVHQRAPSSSSIGSTGSVSPYHQGLSTGQRRVTDQASRKPTNLTHAYSGSQSSIRNHLPTPTQTPTQEHFLAPSNSNFRQQQRQSVDSTALLEGSPFSFANMRAAA